MDNNKINDILTEVKKVIIGKDEILKKVLLSIMARGHILIEDIPGVGKTTLALAFSKAMDLKCKRLQFTPDVLPSDITGFSMFDKKTDNFVYKPGAAMCNLFLADEINRTSSKTQAALLEIMEEGNISIDGTTRELPSPYIVIATQNPIGSVGTHMLPESQLDRFMIRLTMGYPDIKSEIEILKTKQDKVPLNDVNKVVTAEEIVNIQNNVEKVYINDTSYEYIGRLVQETRENQLIQLGVSPRGTLAIAKMAKANAYFKGREYVIPEDIIEIFADVVRHRIILNPRAISSDMTLEKVIANISQGVQLPKVSKE